MNGTGYHGSIASALKGREIPEGATPGLVESFMRLQYGTLDHLDLRTFNREARLCLEAIRTLSPKEKADFMIDVRPCSCAACVTFHGNTTERERQEAVARTQPYTYTWVFDCADGEVFRAIAPSQAGALRVLNAERPGIEARFTGCVRA